VQIIVEISQGEGGRAIGTVRAAGHEPARPFSGNLEFLALIESIYRIGADTVGDDASANDKERS
jgi:hypothetical protein